VISHEEEQPARLLRIEQALHHTPRVGPAIDGIAQNNQRIVRDERQLIEQQIERHVAAVDVT
jgi:hypothetical protein